MRLTLLVPLFVALTAIAAAQDAPDTSAGPAQNAAPVLRQTPPPDAAPHQSSESVPPPPPFDPTLFEKPIPADQLAFLRTFAGMSSGDALHDRQFRRLLKTFVPDCIFHYGRDMSLNDALDSVFTNSRSPVLLRDNRFLILSGNSGPYLRGRALLWIDLQQGIGLGGFFFAPTNGEPSPTLAVFSRQVRETALGLSQLPPEFANDLDTWSASSGLPPIEVRYFLTGSNKRVLLEHDEDLCAPTAGVAPNDCENLNADAADLDLTTAYYLEQVHYATNATAYMLRNADMTDFLVLRDRRCGSLADPLGCRIRLSHEHIRRITGRPPLHR